MAPPNAPSLLSGSDGRLRCFWCGDQADYVAYHDAEWGVPVTSEARLFEKICLEGFQSGLSWLTILRKRPAFRRAFADFDPEVVAGFSEVEVTRLLGDAGIVRHRGKIEATIKNARAVLSVRARHGSLARLLWSFEPDPATRPTHLDRSSLSAMASTPASKALAKALKAEGFAFFGPTTAYAMMQSVGMVNDHLEGCWRRTGIEAMRAALIRPVA